MNETNFNDYVNQLQKAIECSICLDELNDPVETRCGHTFCGDCLYTAFSKNSVVPCPLCKYVIKKRGIKKATYLSKVVASVKNLKKACVSSLHLTGFPESSSADNFNSNVKSKFTCEKQNFTSSNTHTSDLNDFVDDSLVLSPRKSKRIQMSNVLLYNNSNDKDVFSFPSSPCDLKKSKVKEFNNNKQCVYRKAPRKSSKRVKLAPKHKSTIKKGRALRNVDDDQNAEVGSSPISNHSKSLIKVGADPAQHDNDEQDIEKKRNVQNKVCDWLETVHPSVGIQIDDNTCEKPQCDVDDSEIDDLMSASQQLSPFSSKRNLHSNISKSVLKAIKSKSAELNAEVFGGKSKHQYKPKQAVKNVLHCASPTAEPLSPPAFTKVNIKKAGKKGRNKKFRSKKNMFDIIGLSQGVSPFSSPSKDEHLVRSQKSVNENHNIDSVETYIDTSPSKSTINNCLSINSQRYHSDKPAPKMVANAKDTVDLTEKCYSQNIDQDKSKSASDICVMDANSLKSETSSINDKDTAKLICNIQGSSQESKSTVSTLDHKCNITTVAAVIHSPPAEKNIKTLTKSKDTIFKTPVLDKTICSKQVSTLKSRSCLLRLEDMPIVCVGETQDDSERNQSYYVETPAQSVSSVIQNNLMKSPAKNVEDFNKTSTELGLLQFSPPSENNTESFDRLQLPEALSLPILSTKADEIKANKTSDDDDASTTCVMKSKIGALNSTLAKTNQSNSTQDSSLVLNKTINSFEETPNTNKCGDDVLSLETNLIQNTVQCSDSNSIMSSIKEKNMLKQNRHKNITESKFRDIDIVPETELFEEDVEVSKLEEVQEVAKSLSGGGGQSYETNLEHDDWCQLDIVTAKETKFCPEKVKYANYNGVHAFGTWPQPNNQNSSLKPSLFNKDNEQAKAGRKFENDQIPADADLVEISNIANSPNYDCVSSSPLLFAPSQSQGQSINKIHASQQQALPNISEQCQHRLMIDKMVQCPDSFQVTTESFSEMLELTKRLKVLCQKLERSASVSNKINELEELLIHQCSPYPLEKLSNEATIRPSTIRRRRILSTSEDELRSSPFKPRNEDDNLDLSDVEHFEIENSLPEINRKLRPSNVRDRNRVLTLSGGEDLSSAQSTPHSSPESSKRIGSSTLNRPIERSPDNQDLSVSANNTASDVINNTCKSKCRKRVLSSSDDDDDDDVILQRKSSKKRRDGPVSVSPKYQHFSESANGLDKFDDVSPGKMKLGIDYQAVEAKNLRDQTSNHDLPTDVAIEETPSLNGSQIRSPTPPPSQHPLDVAADTSGVQEILNSISKMTENEKNENNGSIEIVSSDDEIEQKENRNPNTQLETANEKSSFGNQNQEKPNKTPEEIKRPEQAMPSFPVSPGDLSVSDSSYTAGQRKFGVMVSGLRGKAIGLVRLFAKKWNGEFFENYVAGKVTHAVVRTQNMKCDRTLKFLQAVASKAWIVSISWVTRSLKEKTLLPEDNFEVSGDNLDTSEEHSFAPKRSRLSTSAFKLLNGYAVYCIPPFALFTEVQFVELLRLCGARVCSRPDDLSFCSNEKRIITVDPDAHPDTLPNYAELAEKYNATAVACSWVLDCIGTFNLQPISNFPVEDFDTEMLSCD